MWRSAMRELFTPVICLPRAYRSWFGKKGGFSKGRTIIICSYWKTTPLTYHLPLHTPTCNSKKLIFLYSTSHTREHQFLNNSFTGLFIISIYVKGALFKRKEPTDIRSWPLSQCSGTTQHWQPCTTWASWCSMSSAGPVWSDYKMDEWWGENHRW